MDAGGKTTYFGRTNEVPYGDALKRFRKFLAVRSTRKGDTTRKGDSHQIWSGRDIHGFLPRYPSFVNLVAVTFSLSRSTVRPRTTRPRATGSGSVATCP